MLIETFQLSVTRSQNASLTLKFWINSTTRLELASNWQGQSSSRATSGSTICLLINIIFTSLISRKVKLFNFFLLKLDKCWKTISSYSSFGLKSFFTHLKTSHTKAPTKLKVIFPLKTFTSAISESKSMLRRWNSESSEMKTCNSTFKLKLKC